GDNKERDRAIAWSDGEGTKRTALRTRYSTQDKKFISRSNCDLDRGPGGSGITHRDRAGAKEKGLRSRERQFQGKRQRSVGGRSAGWRHEICRNFAAAGASEVCDQ